jgi:hypothetical protein
MKRMLAFKKPKQLQWTAHARMKMNYYRLSPARVRHVLHSPKRIEEGVAPKTVAMMQPTLIKNVGSAETWTQEIWVMIQDTNKFRKVISAWRYPGMTKPRAAFLQKEYREFISKK